MINTMRNGLVVKKNVTPQSVCGVILLSLMLSTTAQADGLECNLGQFSLSNEQKERLKDFRVQNRKYMRSAAAQQKGTDAYQKRVTNLLLQRDFNESQAKRVVKERLEEQSVRDVEQLKMYHMFLQVLTPEQRNVWLRNCVRIR